jgi:hypothetical protein
MQWDCCGYEEVKFLDRIHNSEILFVVCSKDNGHLFTADREGLLKQFS